MSLYATLVFSTDVVPEVSHRNGSIKVKIGDLVLEMSRDSFVVFVKELVSKGSLAGIDFTSLREGR